MRFVRYVFPIAVLAALSLTTTAAPTATTTSSSPDSLVDRIVEARKKVWLWQRVMHRKLAVPKLTQEELAATSAEYQERALAYWRQRVQRVRARAMNPPHERQFRCIHRHEGPWTANTGNGYYGGLQMDVSFQRSYGPRFVRAKGFAHRWKPLEQIWVGERALRQGRGFYPWPTAARRCGLI